MTLPTKTVGQSRTEQVHIVMPAHTNGNHRLFGGMLMSWIDVVAGVCARRHCEGQVATVCVDELSFEAPAFVDQIVVLQGQLCSVGRTSMEIRVDSYVEASDGVRTRINRAYCVMVALDDQGTPVPVPALQCETAQEEEESNLAFVRDTLRKKRRSLRL